MLLFSWQIIYRVAENRRYTLSYSCDICAYHRTVFSWIKSTKVTKKRQFLLNCHFFRCEYLHKLILISIWYFLLCCKFQLLLKTTNISHLFANCILMIIISSTHNSNHNTVKYLQWKKLNACLLLKLKQQMLTYYIWRLYLWNAIMFQD